MAGGFKSYPLAKVLLRDAGQLLCQGPLVLLHILGIEGWGEGLAVGHAGVARATNSPLVDIEEDLAFRCLYDNSPLFGVVPIEPDPTRRQLIAQLLHHHRQLQVSH